jgi:nucleoside-diphosphate-sugar epimerase
MRTLVTGVAGFVGSHLAQSLLERGDSVVGLDALTSYYDIGQKRANLRRLADHPEFTSIEVDLRTAPLAEFLHGIDQVFHQAAQPGVRASWGSFSSYVEHNILATQRMLDAAKAADVSRFVYASSSSIYGNTVAYPTLEDAIPKPHSPYGVTKLAGEHLVRLFGQNWGFPTVSLRYFTVYGPGQRPDMAMHRLIDAALLGRKFPLYGDGSALRDFTYVGDVVAANLAAADRPVPPGTVVNVAGGGSIKMADLIALVGQLTGSPVQLDRLPEQAGDVQQTGGDISAARELLGWKPEVGIEEGLTAQVAWQRERLGERLHR